MNALDLGRVGIWAGEMDRYPALTLRQAAAAIDDLGYPALWFPETTGREAMAQAALLLSATRQTVVATGTASIYARDASRAAAAQRTRAEAFPARFLLGLGVSHPALGTDVRGHRFGPPVATMRAYLDAMEAAPFGPPIPAAPRVLAALGPKMLQLAAERTCGAHPLGMARHCWPGRARWGCWRSTVSCRAGCRPTNWPTHCCTTSSPAACGWNRTKRAGCQGGGPLLCEGRQR
ncbi:MAG TPA: LLM class flavin-dependent oxidoreductase [Nonomuraea sp.]|nr:LLM class flavin-dependent oxidoreductase [Nonomuraea sp.]